MIKKAAENYMRQIVHLDLLDAALAFVGEQGTATRAHSALQRPEFWSAIRTAQLCVAEAYRQTMVNGLALGYLAGDKRLMRRHVRRIFGDSHFRDEDGLKLAIAHHLPLGLYGQFKSEDLKAFEVSVTKARRARGV